MKKIAKFEKVSIEQFRQGYPNDDVKSVYDAIKLPKRATAGSAGYDFFAPFDIELKAGETVKVPTGIRVKIDEGWLLSLYPRWGSSTATTTSPTTRGISSQRSPTTPRRARPSPSPRARALCREYSPSTA